MALSASVAVAVMVYGLVSTWLAARFTPPLPNTGPAVSPRGVTGTLVTPVRSAPDTVMVVTAYW